ncbi:MAG: hypothetical protein SOY12_10525 [Schaedlerella sp.]|nr:hypothetical protein [Lachnospiraceae bacterium]MDY4203450.1 hypothetical protein [Schaedlerella sp.]
MNKKKVVKILKILAGIYLIIIGGCLLRDITLTSPTNKTMLAAASIVFILTGIWYAFVSMELKIKIPDFRGYLDTLEKNEPDQEKNSSTEFEEEEIVPAKRRNNVVMHSLSRTEESAVTGKGKAGEKMEDRILKPEAEKNLESVTDAKSDSVLKTEPSDIGRETKFLDIDSITGLHSSDSAQFTEKTVPLENISDFTEKREQIKKKHAAKVEKEENKKKKSKGASKHPTEKGDADGQSNKAAAETDKKDDKQEV